MPLSELLYRLAKEKFDSSQEKNSTCSTPGVENDFVELVWDNGQIQSSRARKSENSASQNLKIRDKDIGNGSNLRMERFGAMDSGIDEVPVSISVPSGLHQDDDMVPWLNYPIDDCSEFLSELSDVTVNEHSQNNFTPLDNRTSSSCCNNQSIRDSHTVSVHDGSGLAQGYAPKLSSVGDSDVTRARSSATQLYPSSYHQCQTSFPYIRSRTLSSHHEMLNSPLHYAASGDSMRVLSSGGGNFLNVKAHKEPPLRSSSTSGLVNFSHFSRPAAAVKANLQNICTRSGSGMSNIERNKRMVRTDKDKNTANTTELIDTFSSFQKEMNSQNCPVAATSEVDAKLIDPKPAEEPVPAKRPEDLVQVDGSRNNKYCVQVAESATKGMVDGEKTSEPIVTSSSVCSVNSVERISDEPTQNLKRKDREADSSEGPSEENEDEPVGAKKAAHGRGGGGCKRSRAAEVHNLSERRRRDRINEKMRALQELIPNCNKVDKASMLDEAIEYLKTLQLQVQIMSMGSGLYMPSMMMTPGMPHIHAAHMAQFSPMGVGMGMGMGFGMGMADMISGSSGCSMIQIPPIHGAHFPGPPMPGPSAMYGMAGSNFSTFGLSSLGHPMQYPCPPMMPMSGGSVLRPMGINGGVVGGPVDNLDSAPGSRPKDPIQNTNSQNDGANNSMNQTSTQDQINSDGKPALVQNGAQTLEVTEHGTLESANRQ